MHHIFSNWMSGFKPRVRPDFSRGFYVPGYKLIKVICIRQNLTLSQEIKRRVVALLMYISAKIRQGGIRPYFNSFS